MLSLFLHIYWHLFLLLEAVLNLNYQKNDGSKIETFAFSALGICFCCYLFKWIKLPLELFLSCKIPQIIKYTKMGCRNLHLKPIHIIIIILKISRHIPTISRGCCSELKKVEDGPAGVIYIL